MSVARRQSVRALLEDALAVEVTAGVIAIGMVVAGAGYLFSPDWIQVHAEGGIIESMQASIWGVAAACGLLALPRQRSPRARSLVRFLGVLALLALAREFDLHEAVNPESAGALGVRYRLDWWADPTSPIVPRVLWAGVAIAAGGLVARALGRLRPDPIGALGRGDLSAWLLVLAGGLLGCGYAADDLLRGLLPREGLQAAEELAELAGAACFLGGVLARLRPAAIAATPVEDDRNAALAGGAAGV